MAGSHDGESATVATVGTPGDEGFSLVDALVAKGRMTEAVDVLAARNRRSPTAADAVRLVELRSRATAGNYGEGRTPWPPEYGDPFPGLVQRVPEIPAERLTADVLGGAVLYHGSLIVRGVFSATQVARSVQLIEHVHSLREGVRPGAHEPDGVADAAWYHPLVTDRPKKNEALRQGVAAQGGTWLADSPVATAQILGELEDAGVIPAIAGHLGERPFFSLQKSTLRRSPPVFNLVAWHQDGSFLDRAVRTMNVWVALSPCGGDLPTPGLEIVPKRIAEVLPVDGVMSPHSVSYDLVAEIAADTPTVIPEFAPGDAILFDERCLHRTHLREGMTDIRYALECWFFAPSHQSPNYTPLLV